MSEIDEMVAKLERQRKAERVEEIFGETSDLVWNALPPDARRTRSTENDVSRPDYDRDFVSQGQDHYDAEATSYRGPEYWTEKKEVEDDWNVQQADRIGEECRTDYARRAQMKCAKGELPNGSRDDTLTVAQCMGFWADGLADEIASSSTMAQTARSSSHELAVEGEATANAGFANVKAKGALRHGGGESTATSQTAGRSKVREGYEGYQRECARKEHDWYANRIDAMEPYSE